MLHGNIRKTREIVGVYRTDRIKNETCYNLRRNYWEKLIDHIRIIDGINNMLPKKLCFERIKERYIESYLPGYLDSLRREEINGIKTNISELIGSKKCEQYVKKRIERDDEELISNLEIQKRALDEKIKLLVFWNKNKGVIERALTHYGFRNVAVYGIQFFGDCLINELKNSKIKVMYGIDRNAGKFAGYDIPIYSTENDLPKIDAVVVTVMASVNSVISILKNKFDESTQIIHIETLLHQDRQDGFY